MLNKRFHTVIMKTRLGVNGRLQEHDIMYMSFEIKHPLQIRTLLLTSGKINHQNLRNINVIENCLTTNY